MSDKIKKLQIGALNKGMPVDLVESYANRIEELREMADEEGIQLNPESEADFWTAIPDLSPKDKNEKDDVV